jgi:hypothetical protein
MNHTSRQQRHHVDRALRKLFRQDNCSVCGTPFRHNSQTAGGLDAQGNVVLAGECCVSRVVRIFTLGFYSMRNYDFLAPRKPKSNGNLTCEQIVDAIAAYQKAIAETDKRLDDTERRGGVVGRSLGANLRDSPWKENDRIWFEQNPARSHRARAAFPGEFDEQVTKTHTGQALIVLLRQVEPGSRLRTVLYLNAALLPLLDDEAGVHAFFEIAMEREPVPPDRQALFALVEKYRTREEVGQ